MFLANCFFTEFRLKLARTGGVRGDGMDHTKTLSRTLAGFGLTWHRKVNFSTFDGKLQGSLMAKCLQIASWISPKTKGFWLNGLRRKSILKNDPEKNIISGKLGNPQKSPFVYKMASLFMPFFGGGPSKSWMASRRWPDRDQIGTRSGWGWGKGGISGRNFTKRFQRTGFQRTGRSRLFRFIGNAMAFSAIPIYWD